MTDAKRLLTNSRRDLWRKCVEDHANEDWGTTCDACLYLPEVYAQLEAVEARLPDYLAAVSALDSALRSTCFQSWHYEHCAPWHNEARAALARLRDEVTA